MGAPTLIVGLGGKGIQIVELIAARAAEEGVSDVQFVVMDTDVNDLRRVRMNKANIHTIQTSPKGIVGAALDNNAAAREGWFPLNAGLMGKPFTEGAGQVRAVSRLAFDHAVEQGYMRELEAAIEQLHGISGDTLRQEMRIMITGSIAGGTGSGILLPVAMYIRNFLKTRYQDDSAIIRGFFLQPDTLFDVIKDEEERNSLRCNAYATIRELDAFFRKEYSGDGPEFKHVVFNAPQPGMSERLDYPNILPYHFIFLMDAINALGETLPNSNAYIEHIADVIFAQTLSQGSARSNSAEDNVIRLLSASGGRSRYCGAGCAYLEYPSRKVQSFIGLTWASNSISHEWMEIDNEYKRLEQEGKAGNRDAHYRDFFDTNTTRGFYQKASKGTTRKISVNGVDTDERLVSDMFVDAVIAHAETWNETGLLKYCDELSAFVKRQDEPDAAPQDDESVHDRIEAQGIDGVADNFDEVFEYNEKHYAIINESVRRAAQEYASMDYSVSEFAENPLLSRKEDWYLEPYIYNDGETLHPSGVRYLLSSIAVRLGDELTAMKSNRDGLLESIKHDLNQDFFKDTDDDDDVRTAVDEITGQDNRNKGRFARFLPGHSGLSAEGESNLANLGRKLNRITQDVEQYRKLVVECEICQAALSYVNRLNRAYRDFYTYLGEQIDPLEAEVEAIRYDGDFNAERGVTRRYVCASTRCLEHLEKKCPQKGDAGDIPADLCGDIYRALLRYTNLINVVAEERDLSTIEKNRSFGRLFDRTIKDFWVKRVLDPGFGYPSIVDKTIVQAILDEARYLHPEEAGDPTTGRQFLESYLETAFNEAAKFATPFIEAPTGEQPRRIALCTYSKEILERVGPTLPKLRDILSDHNGTEVSAGEFSKHIIMFYSSLYGFCATNLPKYAPEHKGMQHRAEGEYHRVYWNMVKQLSPDLSANRLITPHIDRNWHLISFLPDLNEEYEAQLKNEIMRAYLFGLTNSQFDSKVVKSGYLFSLKPARGQTRIDLLVSNHTHCDKFYEVFDSLKFSPPVVYELLARSDKSLADERANAVTLEPEVSRLVKNIGSQAFARTQSITPDAVLDRIKSYESDEKALAGFYKASRDAANELLSDMVTMMFDQEDPDTGKPILRSLFEIPVFYKISLPHTEERVGEIDSMLDGIIETVHDYFANFCDANELNDVCEQFFREQYLRFEYNLVELDTLFPGCGTDQTASDVRAKVISFFDLSGAMGDELDRQVKKIQNAWKRVRAARREINANGLSQLDE